MRWPWENEPVEEATDAPPEPGTLCVDIGGTWIKYGIIPSKPTLASLASVQVRKTESKRWLNGKLANLLNPYIDGSIVEERDEGRYERIAVCIGSAIREADQAIVGRYFLGRGVPADLVEKLRGDTTVPVTLLNDGRAWADGLLACARLSESWVPLPALLLVLGTGVACAWVDADGRVEPREFIAPFKLPHLRRASGIPSAGPNDVHRILGQPFFDYAARAPQSWDDQRVGAEFTDRIGALVADVSDQWGRPASVLIGGGRAGSVSSGTLNIRTRILVRPLALLAKGIDLNMIPLIGAAAYAGGA